MSKAGRDLKDERPYEKGMDPSRVSSHESKTLEMSDGRSDHAGHASDTLQEEDTTHPLRLREYVALPLELLGAHGASDRDGLLPVAGDQVEATSGHDRSELPGVREGCAACLPRKGDYASCDPILESLWFPVDHLDIGQISNTAMTKMFSIADLNGIDLSRPVDRVKEYPVSVDRWKTGGRRRDGHGVI
jgi:hypothetical protein